MWRVSLARTRRTKKEIEEAKARGETFRDQTGGNRSRKVGGKSRSERGVDLRTVKGSVFRKQQVDPEREAERSRKFGVRIADRKRKEALRIETDRVNKEEQDQRDKQTRIDELNQIQAEQDEFDSKLREKEQQGFDREEAIEQVERDDRREQISQGSDSARRLAIEDFGEEFDRSDSAEAREIDAQIQFIFDGTGIRRPKRSTFLKTNDRFAVDDSGKVTVLPITEQTTGFDEAQRRTKRGTVTREMLKAQGRLTEQRSFTDVDNDPTTFAKGGFFGMVNKKRKFVVGEKGMEFVNVMPKNNMFEFARGMKKTKNKAKNNMFDVSFNSKNNSDNIFNPMVSKKSKGKKRKKANNDFDFLSGF